MGVPCGVRGRMAELHRALEGAYKNIGRGQGPCPRHCHEDKGPRRTHGDIRAPEWTKIPDNGSEFPPWIRHDTPERAATNPVHW